MPDSEHWFAIGEVAARTGVAPSALRYYEELGLIPAVPRVAGRRRYPVSTIGLVGTIVLLRQVGFSLVEIRTLVTSRAPWRKGWRTMAHQKVAQLDEQIAKAHTARDALEHALRCRHRDLRSCPNFAGVLAAALDGHPLQQAHVH
jgi:DNA-binding transcriptional MerR regulator